ncbi:MAG TPA: DUF4173 domain-containing protein [Gemmatimonadota bacterium]|nr:DUF4173 domain-containing protein [Gemmatimonadota bacterium]
MLSRQRALGIAFSALALGLIGDLLLRPQPAGLGAAVWIAGCAGTAIAFRPGRSAIRALAVSAAFGLLIVWRDSPALQGLSAMAAIVAWGVAFLERPARTSVTSLAMAACATAASALLGSPLVLGSTRRGEPLALPRLSFRIALGGAAMAVPLLLLFGTLFAAADPLVAHYTSDLAHSLDEVLEHLGTIASLAWLTGGLLAGLLLARCPARIGLPGPRPALGAAIAVAVALVVALFAAFLAVQARALLGGADWVESRVGLSYSEYARGGFFQLLACVGIALPLGLVADWAVSPEDPRRPRMALLSAALAVAVLAVVASAARRMTLYVEAYGLTELRLYASAIMLWLGIASVAFGVAAIRGTRERFSLHALLAAALVVAGLGILNPGSRIAAFNAARNLGAGPSFDAGYAVSLGADAVPALLDAFPSLSPSAQCATARGLLTYRARLADGDWRTYNVSRARAGTLLVAADGALRNAAAVCDQAPRRDA